MEELKKRVWNEIVSEMEKLDGRETPDGEDYYCGSCTGDPHYNENYWSEMTETETFKYVSNSCQDTFWKDGEIVIFSQLDYDELKDLLVAVREEVASALEKQEESKKDLESIL